MRAITVRIIISLCCILLIGGCASLKTGNRSGAARDFKVSSTMPAPPNIVPLQIKRSKLEKSIENSVGKRNIRIVRIFRRDASQLVQEYRVFDVRKESPFHLLGMRSGDVLLGVNDRPILQADIMLAYPQAVLQDGKSSITLNRGEKLFQLDILLK